MQWLPPLAKSNGGTAPRRCDLAAESAHEVARHQHVGNVREQVRRQLREQTERHQLARQWARAAHALDLAPELARRGTTVLLDGDDGYPISDEVPDRPAVLLRNYAKPKRANTTDNSMSAAIGAPAAGFLKS